MPATFPHPEAGPPGPDRQWVISNDLVDGGDGRVTFNRLQQNIPEPEYDDGQPDVLTTDPWDITPTA